MPKSYLHRTRLAIDQRLGVVTRDDAAGVTIVRYPHNPTFYCGNYALFDDAPQPGDGARWQERFVAAFADAPEVRHQTIEWDAPDGELGACGELVRAGFELECCFGMMTSAMVAPVTTPPGFTLRPLDPSDDADWDALLAMMHETFEDDAHRPSTFLQGRVADFRTLSRYPHTMWWGAFHEEHSGARTDRVLISALGVVGVEGWGRYQEIITAPTFRRRGLASALVRLAGAQALRSDAVDRLALEVAADNHPARLLYTSVGFAVTEYTAALWKGPMAEAGGEG